LGVKQIDTALFLFFFSYYNKEFTFSYRVSTESSNINRSPILKISVGDYIYILKEIKKYNCKIGINCINEETSNLTINSKTNFSSEIEITNHCNEKCNYSFAEKYSKKKKFTSLHKEVFREKIVDCNISNRLKNALNKANIDLVENVLNLVESDILKIEGIGKKTLLELHILIDNILEHPDNILREISANEKKEEILTFELKEDFCMFDVSELKLELTEKDDEYYTNIALEFQEELLSIIKVKNNTRNVDMFLLYTGLIGDANYTFQNIGNMYGISRERVRQVVVKISRKLKSIHFGSSIRSLFYDFQSSDMANIMFYSIINVFGRNFVKTFSRIVFTEKNLMILFNNRIEELINYHKYASRGLSKEKRKIRDAHVRIIDNIVWPDGCSFDNFSYFNGLEKLREVNPNNNIGSFVTKKFTDSLEYESGIEMKVLGKLASCPEVNDIKAQSLKIQYFFESKEGGYYPDFVVLFSDGRIAIIEVKIVLDMVTSKTLVKYDALKSFCEDKGFGYAMLNDRGDTLEKLKLTEKQKDLSNILSNNRSIIEGIRYKDFKVIKDNIDLTNGDLYSILYFNRNNFDFSIRPFKLKAIE